MREALVVAVDDYRHPSLRPLTAPARDARALADVLGDTAAGAFDKVTILHNPSAPELTRAAEVLFRSPERRSSDLVLLYFSGHGVKDDAGRLFFATGETDPDFLVSTALGAGTVHDLMGQCAARQQVVLLDCCFAGAVAKALLAKGDAGRTWPRCCHRLGGGS